MFLVSLWTGNIQDGFQQTWNWGSTPRRSRSTGRGSPARSCTAGWPRSSPSRSASRSPTRSRSAAAPTRTSCCSWSSPRSSRASCCGRSRGRSSSPTTGIVLGPLKDASGSCPADFQLLGTPAAVIAGITYNFLPFMTLPLYVALEKIDRRLIEAAQDLYAGPWRPRGHVRRRRSLGGVLGRRRRRRSWTTAPLALAHPRSRSPAPIDRDVADQRGVHPGHAAARAAGHLRRVAARRSSRRSATTSTPSCWATRSR